jgi:hypothetical protein
MSEQRTFANLAWQNRKKVTRREQFLAEMNRDDPVGGPAGAVRAALPHRLARPVSSASSAFSLLSPRESSCFFRLSLGWSGGLAHGQDGIAVFVRNIS